MKAFLTEKDVTHAVKQSVATYLLARVYAETMRESVNKIQREILVESPLPGKNSEQITDPKKAWECENDSACADYYAKCNARERIVGLKPDDMPDDYCPALVAENIQRIAEKAIIDASAEMLRYDGGGKDLHHRLLCAGLDKLHQFLDLVVGLVINLPDFENPLKKIANAA